MRALEAHPFAAIARAIENAAEVEMVLGLPARERRRVLSSEPETRPLVFLDMMAHAMDASGSTLSPDNHALGDMGNRVLFAYWQDVFRHGPGRMTRAGESHGASHDAGGHMLKTFRTALLVGTLANTEPLLGLPTSAGGEAQGGGWAEQHAVIDQIGVRLWGALLGGLQFQQASSAVPDCKVRSDDEAEQAVRHSVASSVAIVRSEVNETATKARMLVARAKEVVAREASDHPTLACKADEVLLGPECDGDGRERSGCHCAKWDSVFTLDVISSCFLQTSYTKMSEPSRGAARGDSSAGGASVLLYLGLGNLSGRGEFAGSLGGGERGFEGFLMFRDTVGKVFFADELDGSALVVRGGLMTIEEGNSAYHHSLLELPSSEVAYHFHRGATRLEIGGRLGLALAGRLDLRSGAQRLGVGGDAGVNADVLTRRLRLGVRVMEEGVKLHLGPALVGDAFVCLRLQQGNASLCVEGRLERADMSVTAGGPSAIQFLGLQLGLGERLFL